MGKAFAGAPEESVEPGIAEAAFAIEGAGAGLPAVLRGVLCGQLALTFFAIPDPPCRTPAARQKHYVSAWQGSVTCEDTIRSYLRALWRKIYFYSPFSGLLRSSGITPLCKKLSSRECACIMSFRALDRLCEA